MTTTSLEIQLKLKNRHGVQRTLTAKSQYAPYQALGYILKTGANWAKPIQSFKLTIERDPNELVSFCWNGQVKKISSTQFQMTEKNFVPKQDLDIIFVRKF
ncbi:DUF4424 family protein [Acinetobacter johnsonii]|uniref:DUF4424 family protein n=1 Tax=Acinetobacter johnsonii TaxID=40214 RepID=UPI00374D978B